MHFKHPELLYALFLLVIPVLVHLFQLRRFRTEKFTNVKFLKKAVLQTRKSSQLKKWLILFTRLGLLACIIIAFAQPYFPSEAGTNRAPENVIYLDNSYSMQAKGQNGVLLKRSVQDLLESLPEEGTVSFFTNDAEFSNINIPGLRKKLQQLDFSSEQLPWKTVALKAQNLIAPASEAQQNFIAISDFQSLKEAEEMQVPNGINNFLVQLQPENRNNIAIDSAYISSKNLDETNLEVKLKAFGSTIDEVSVGLYDGQNLLARKTVQIDENSEANTSFSLPSGSIPNGRISIEDNALLFDNELYFSINETPPVEVVVIGDTDATFLSRIYKAPEFNFSSFPQNNIDYNLLLQADLVILSELENIQGSLTGNLQKLSEEQVYVVVIPSADSNLQDYNSLFQNLELPGFTQKVEQERLITEISYAHPLYTAVFDEQVENFQYPKVQTYFLPNKRETPVLSFENGDAFLYQDRNIFVFTAPINRENSNFRSAPLIVPTFYNIGNLAISPSQLYAVLGEPQNMSIQAQLEKDEILRLASDDFRFIPRQQSFQNKVEIYLEDAPQKEGHYKVLKDSAQLRTLSFNLNRNESRLNYHKLDAIENVNVQNSIPQVFREIRSANEVDSLWKWFVIFALFFLVSEMLILKFFK